MDNNLEEFRIDIRFNVRNKYMYALNKNIIIFYILQVYVYCRDRVVMCLWSKGQDLCTLRDVIGYHDNKVQSSSILQCSPEAA